MGLSVRPSSCVLTRRPFSTSSGGSMRMTPSSPTTTVIADNAVTNRGVADVDSGLHLDELGHRRIAYVCGPRERAGR